MNTKLKCETETDRIWDYLIESEIATEDELRLVTSINGNNEEALNSVLYVRTAYRSIDQLIECEGE